VTTRHSVVAPGKSWSNFVVVTTLLVDSKVGIVDYWSAKEWREFCHPSRANEAPPASQPAQHLSGSFQLNEAHVCRVLRFGYLAPDQCFAPHPSVQIISGGTKPYSKGLRERTASIMLNEFAQLKRTRLRRCPIQWWLHSPAVSLDPKSFGMSRRSIAGISNRHGSI